MEFERKLHEMLPRNCGWRTDIQADRHGVLIELQDAAEYTWWRHQMETFSALLAICLRNSPVTGEFPAQRPVTRSFDVFFDLRLNKQWLGWCFETPSRPLWRRCIENTWEHQQQENAIESDAFDAAIWHQLESRFQQSGPLSRKLTMK